MSLYDFVVSYLFINILNIPLACIFKKVWINYINAFIPFNNIVDYLWISGVKRKYFFALMTLFIVLILIFLIDVEIIGSGLNFGLLRGLSMYEFTLDKLLSWIFLLLLIPIFVIFLWINWLFFWVFIAIDGLVWFLRSWNWLLEILISPLIISISVFLIRFYCKSVYKFALNFGWKHKVAILYVIFQPIAIWILAFWKWEYQSDNLGDQDNKELENKDMKVN